MTRAESPSKIPTLHAHAGRTHACARAGLVWYRPNGSRGVCARARTKGKDFTRRLCAGFGLTDFSSVLLKKIALPYIFQFGTIVSTCKISGYNVQSSVYIQAWRRLWKSPRPSWDTKNRVSCAKTAFRYVKKYSLRPRRSGTRSFKTRNVRQTAFGAQKRGWPVSYDNPTLGDSHHRQLETLITRSRKYMKTLSLPIDKRNIGSTI